MERPYRRYALLSPHNGSTFEGVNSIMTYGVVGLDMFRLGNMPSCDFSRSVVLGLKENPQEAKENLEALLMFAHDSLMHYIDDMDIDFGTVLLVGVPDGTDMKYVKGKIIEHFYADMIEELKNNPIRLL